ncbi:thioesterase II family protein [Streptomyces arenae]|uniref:thioesterase II family protein n=1 Tax=Streptomyces arenae TaxID=29301 RepID=UPI002658DDDF|nr:alpha/beta fold hydrolase [Streptomyces arenae]MCG7204957.1 alpha/beta fold hydrolase [Streptomyces arenae]
MNVRTTPEPVGRWLLRWPAAGVRTVQLLCVPYAGGSSAVFRSWADGLAPGVEVLGVDLPGHGRRFTEPPRIRMDEIVTALADDIQSVLAGPLYLFGHSLGGLVAYETARELTARGQGPEHLFVSAVRPPDRRVAAPLHWLDDTGMLAGLARLGGIPDEVLADEELVAAFLPVLRADLTLRETYVPGTGPMLECPLTVFSGADDATVPAAEIPGWADCSRGEFEQVTLPGGHFFLHDHELLLAQLDQRLDVRRPADRERCER